MTYKIIPPEGFIMPVPYIASKLPAGWRVELGNPHPNIIQTFWGKTPSDAFNQMLFYTVSLKE